MDLIVGGGITGLSFASLTNNEYTLIEKDDSLGGYCRTIRKDGFVWDYSGHFFHFSDDSIRSFIMNSIPQDDILTILKHCQISYKNILIDYPFQKNIHQLDKDDFIDCLYDLLINTYDNPANFKEMLYAKYGKSIAEKFLIPYNEKLYACDLNTLDKNAMGRFFPHADIREIVANFKENNESSYNRSFLYTKNGAQQYVDSLSLRLNKQAVSTNEEIISLDIEKHVAYTSKRIIHYDRLISTIPFPNILRLSGIDFDIGLYSSNKVLVFNIGFNKEGFDTVNDWIYYPEDKYIFYRVGFYNNILSTNRLSVYVEIGYPQNAHVDVQAAFERTLHDLKLAGLISDHIVVSHNHIIMDPAYVHITKEMEEDRAHKKDLLASYDIYSIGRYGGWTYCSIEDNVREAMHLAALLNQ